MPNEALLQRATALQQTVKLIHDASEALIAEWAKNPPPPDAVPASEETGIALPSHAAYDAQRTIVAALGSIEELVAEPHYRLMDFSYAYLGARALHVALNSDIALLLERADGEDERGVPVAELAEATGIHESKLVRLLRLLTSRHVFREVAPGRFANNRISRVLVDDEGLRAQGKLNFMGFAAALALPETLQDPVKGPSQDSNHAAWGTAMGTDLNYFEWLHQQVPLSQAAVVVKAGGHGHGGDDKIDPTSTNNSNGDAVASMDDEKLVTRGNTETYNLALSGYSRSRGRAPLYDFPWNELGDGLVVDVGGGVGSFSLQLAQLYPQLRFIVQDQAVMVDQGLSIWKKKLPAALESGRAHFMEHDFFTPNPVKEADIYWMRNVLHDWNDEDCVRILSRTAEAMGPRSRLLVAGVNLISTLGNPYATPAPHPLLPNYGVHSRHRFDLDLSMMLLVNGKERTSDEHRAIFRRAGLHMIKIWECRSALSIIECRLASGS